MATQTVPQQARTDQVGKRYECEACGSLIEIIKPCSCDPPHQDFRCCGQEMKPARTD